MDKPQVFAIEENNLINFENRVNEMLTDGWEIKHTNSHHVCMPDYAIYDTFRAIMYKEPEEPTKEPDSEISLFAFIAGFIVGSILGILTVHYILL